ncbi:hypothetical protein JCM18920_1814 [Cutibacterium acnes JCM 18920]|nr:hypothetical protein JCM18920_1814 [Cutibacterium acnes JCM 18920]
MPTKRVVPFRVPHGCFGTRRSLDWAAPLFRDGLLLRRSLGDLAIVPAAFT